MAKFDEPPSHEEAKRSLHTSLNSGKNTDEVVHDTSGLMFAYARRSAERLFGLASIYC
jgi:hypothetical protein